MNSNFKAFLHSMFLFICWVIMGFGTVYFLLSFIIDLPSVKNIVGIIVAITFITNAYLNLLPEKYDGQIVITRGHDEKRIFSLELDKNPDDIEYMNKVIFKVSNKESNEYTSIAELSQE